MRGGSGSGSGGGSGGPGWASLGRIGPPVLLLGAVLALWKGATIALGIPAFLLPAPEAVGAAALSLGGVLLRAMVITGGEALAGFGLSVVLGILAALAFQRVPLLGRSAWPYAIFLQTVPIVAVAPLLVIWFGPGFKAVAICAFIVSVFPILTSTYVGLRSIPPEWLELFTLYRARPRDILLKLRLPAALPYAFAGIKTSAGLAVVGAVIGEMVAGTSGNEPGLGYLVISTSRQLKTDQLFAAILASALLGGAVFGAVGILARRVLTRSHRGTGAP